MKLLFSNVHSSTNIYVKHLSTTIGNTNFQMDHFWKKDKQCYVLTEVTTMIAVL